METTETKKTPKLDRAAWLKKQAKKIGKLKFVKLEVRPGFQCQACRGRGKNALVFENPQGKEILLGKTCCEKFGFEWLDLKEQIENSSN